jgi:hypothetical protein
MKPFAKMLGLNVSRASQLKAAGRGSVAANGIDVPFLFEESQGCQVVGRSL